MACLFRPMSFISLEIFEVKGKIRNYNPFMPLVVTFRLPAISLTIFQTLKIMICLKVLVNVHGFWFLINDRLGLVAMFSHSYVVRLVIHQKKVNGPLEHNFSD